MMKAVDNCHETNHQTYDILNNTFRLQEIEHHDLIVVDQFLFNLFCTNLFFLLTKEFIVLNFTTIERKSKNSEYLQCIVINRIIFKHLHGNEADFNRIFFDYRNFRKIYFLGSFGKYISLVEDFDSIFFLSFQAHNFFETS